MSSSSDFVIENGVLKKYNGPGGDVVIPDGVTEIGDRAFFRCGSLESVTIPDGVTHIGKRAFSRCPKVTFRISDAAANRPENFVIENGVLTEYNGPGGDVVIPDGVTGIKGEFPDGAFADCSRLTSVVIPNGVTSIGEFAFSGCERLTSVVLPDSVATIERFAFSGCPAASFHISDAAANRPENYVIENGVLTEYHGPGGDVAIPAGVMRIGGSAFCGCECLTSVTIPAGAASIGDGAFSGCARLTSVVIPETVTELAETAFGADEPELLEWEPCSYELTIRAPAGSAAERYAKKHGISFVAE